MINAQTMCICAFLWGAHIHGVHTFMPITNYILCIIILLYVGVTRCRDASHIHFNCFKPELFCEIGIPIVFKGYSPFVFLRSVQKTLHSHNAQLFRQLFKVRKMYYITFSLKQ